MNHHAISLLQDKRAQMQRCVEGYEVELKAYSQKIEYANNGIHNTLNSLKVVQRTITEIDAELASLGYRK